VQATIDTKKFSMDALLPVRKKKNCMSHFDTSLVTDHYYKKIEFFLLYCNNSNFKKEEKTT
jgi:hypothetical protein